MGEETKEGFRVSSVYSRTCESECYRRCLFTRERNRERIEGESTERREETYQCLDSVGLDEQLRLIGAGHQQRLKELTCVRHERESTQTNLCRHQTHAHTDTHTHRERERERRKRLV
jgi:hypothetical protein